MSVALDFTLDWRIDLLCHGYPVVLILLDRVQLASFALLHLADLYVLRSSRHPVWFVLLETVAVSGNGRSLHYDGLVSNGGHLSVFHVFVWLPSVRLSSFLFPIVQWMQ